MFKKYAYSAWVIAVVTLILVACGAGPAEPTSAEATATPLPPTSTPAEQPEQPPTPVPTSAPESSTPSTVDEGQEGTEPDAEPNPATEEGLGDSAAGDVRTFSIVTEESTASYSVEEEFIGVGFATAVGTTGDVSGEFSVGLNEVQIPVDLAGEITVDLRTLTSDDSRRDRRIRTSWLESDAYPFAVFEFKRVEEFPDSWTEGQEVSFRLVGDMTIREVTQELTFDVTATFDGNTLSGTATTFLLMADFGFDAPEIAGVLTVTDGVTVSVNFVAREGV